MQFIQPAFFLFIIIFFVGWRLPGSWINFRLAYLVAASFIFYGFVDGRSLYVLIAVGMVGFLGALGMEKWPRVRPILLGVTIAASLGFLLFFKYSDFIVTNLAATLSVVGIKLVHKPLLSGTSSVPPLGISFYVLQTVGYLLDVFHGRIKATPNVLHFFAYLAMFPKLLAGPIERGRDLLPQLIAEHKPPDENHRWEGMKLIVFGYFIKMVIADNLVPYVDAAFGAAVVRGSSLYWWVMITAFAIQLYSDFCGYSYIAVGLGKWMGYDLTQNFKNPYISTSLAEFWTRWHVSLSSWLREYIFFPLSRSRLGRGRPHLNMWITMLASGLWHGAAWHFVAWGGLHGLYISLERWTQWPNKIKQFRGGKWLAWLLVMLQVWVGWVFFRAASVPQALQILGVMFRFGGSANLALDVNFYFYLSLGLLREAYVLSGVDLKRVLPSSFCNASEVVLVSLLIVVTLLSKGSGSQFIYFQF